LSYNSFSGPEKGRALKPRRNPTDPEILTYARKMRHSDTRAERRAWVLLRDRRMLGLKFRRQLPIANYIAIFIAKSCG
jgi:very-short-patch-repair endonuclease